MNNGRGKDGAGKLILIYDYKKEEAIVLSNQKAALSLINQRKTVNVWEWRELWSDPVLLDTMTVDKNKTPWELLFKAKEQENWRTRVLFQTEIFTQKITEVTQE